MQPQPIVQRVQLLQIARLHRLEQALQLCAAQRQQTLVAERRQRLLATRCGRIVVAYQIVDAHRGRAVVQIQAATDIADGRLALDLRTDDEAADFGATVCVHVVGPFEADVENLMDGKGLYSNIY